MRISLPAWTLAWTLAAQTPAVLTAVPPPPAPLPPAPLPPAPAAPKGDQRLDALVLSAAIKGDLPALEAALAQGGSPNATHPKTGSAFQAAVWFDHVQIAERLLAAGASGLEEPHDFTGKGGRKVRPLYCAALVGHEAMVRMLLKRGADPKAVTEEGRSALEGAIVAGSSGSVQALLEAGEDPKRRCPVGHSAVWAAAMHGRTDILRILLDHGGDPDSREDHGLTPLMVAAQAGHVDTVRLLLERGAPVYPLNAWERSALSFNREGMDPAAAKAITDLLLKAGAQEGDPLRTIDSAFLYAVADGNLEKARSLLAKGADLHTRGKFQEDASLPDALSLSMDHPEIFTFLMDAGINPHMRSSYDFTALHSAASEGTPEMIERLAAAGLDVNAKSKSAMVPLYKAISGRVKPRNAATLLKLGADPNAKTFMGTTLVDFAQERGEAEVVRLLVAAGAKGPTVAAPRPRPQAESAPKAAAAARPRPAAPEAIDRFELLGLRLGMGEKEVQARYGTASFQVQGGLRVAKLSLAPEQVPLLSGASGITLELALLGGKLAQVIVQYLPADHTAPEAELLERLKGPSSDEESTFQRGKAKFAQRTLTWLGKAHYVEYRRFARIGSQPLSLMLSLLPRQENRPSYDAVTVNTPAGADFYIAQNGAFVEAARVGGRLVFHLERAPFQIGGDHEAMKVALAEHPIGEFTLDLDPAETRRYSVLSRGRCGAVSEGMGYLLVSDGRLGCDSISCLSTEFHRTVKPLSAYKVAYEFTSLYMLDSGEVPLAAAPAALHGFLAVRTDRTLEDGSHVTLTTPIELVFR